MSTEKKSRNAEYALTEFSGGKARGLCIQVTYNVGPYLDRQDRYISLSMVEAQALVVGLSLAHRKVEVLGLTPDARVALVSDLEDWLAGTLADGE